MPNKITEKQKKQVSLYICNALSISAKRKIELEMKTNTELSNYMNELKFSINTTRQISTIGPSEELLQGSRNLLHGKIQGINKENSSASFFSGILNNIKSTVSFIAKKQQPVWAVATYVIIGLLAGRLLLFPSADKPIDISGQENIDMNKLIQSGALSDLRIDQSTLSPSSIKLASHSDERFNVSGNVNDKNIRQILYYLLLNDDVIDNRFQAGKQIRNISK